MKKFVRVLKVFLGAVCTMLFALFFDSGTWPLALIFLLVAMFFFVSEILQSKKNKTKKEEAQLTEMPVYHFTPEQEARYQEFKRKQKEREEQTTEFTIDDMHQFEDIPFNWDFVDQLYHSQGQAWASFNFNHKLIVNDYINQLNQLIVDAHSYIPGISNCYIDCDDLDYDFPIPMYLDSVPNTHLECTPYTASWKVSKYPVSIHFKTSINHEYENGYRCQSYPISGVIRILKDGSIGAADVTFAFFQSVTASKIKFQIRLYGLSLIIRRVDTLEGNIFRFENIKGLD